MRSIRVMVVDDHEVVRLGLRTAVEMEEDMEVVADVGDAQSALREAEIHRPDVVLMDVRMPGVDGIQACRLLRERWPDTRVVMLTSFSDEQAVFASIMAGASGYLLKNTRRAELLGAVRLAAKEQDREAALLSGREREALGLVAKGRTNKEIAASLIISENTARNHVSRILEKLGLSSRTEAATFAAQHGLLEEDTPS